MKTKTLALLLLFVINVSVILHSQNLPKYTLTDLNKVTYTSDQLSKDSVLFLVSSLTCGYCLRELPFYNHLTEKYSTKMKFVVLLENDAEYIQEFKRSNSAFYNEKWIVIPNGLKYSKKIWKEKVFPEYHIFFNGVLIRSFAYSNANTRAEINNFFKNIE